MKSTNTLLLSTAFTGLLVLAGCGGGHSGSTSPVTMMPPPPPAPMTKDLDTAAVLSIIKMQTSETAEPFEVDNAAVAVTPVGDETGSPVSVDGP